MGNTHWTFIVVFIAGLIVGVYITADTVTRSGPAQAELVAYLRGKGLWDQVQKDFGNK